MKRLMSLALLVSLLAICCGNSLAKDPPDDDLAATVNGGFEGFSGLYRAESMFADCWRVYNHMTDMDKVRLLENPALAHTGKRCVRMQQSTSIITTEYFRYEEKVAHRLSLWVRGEGTFSLSVLNSGRLTTTYFGYHEVLKGRAGPDWKMFSATYVPKHAGTEHGGVWIKTEGDVYIDDLCIVPDRKSSLKFLTDVWANVQRISVDTALQKEAASQSRGLVQAGEVAEESLPPIVKVAGRDFWYLNDLSWAPHMEVWKRKNVGMQFGGCEPAFGLALREMEVFSGDKNVASEGKPAAGAAPRPFDGKILKIKFSNLSKLTDGDSSEKTQRNHAEGSTGWHYYMLPMTGWFGIEFPEEQEIDRVVLHHGKNVSFTGLGVKVSHQWVAEHFKLQVREGEFWVDIPGTEVVGNRSLRTEQRFPGIKAEAVRVMILRQRPFHVNFTEEDYWKWWFLTHRWYLHYSGPEDTEQGANLARRLFEEELAWRPFYIVTYLRGECYQAPESSKYAEEMYALRSLERKFGERFLGFCMGEALNDIPKYELSLPITGKRISVDSKEMGMAFAEERLRNSYRRYYGRALYAPESRALFFHHALAWGARACGFESSCWSGHNIYRQLIFARGAARQFGTYWVAYPAPNLQNHYRYYKADRKVETHGMARGPDCGASGNWLKRYFFTSFLAGCNMIDSEENGGAFHNQDTGEMLDYGKALYSFLEYSEKDGSRGVPHIPVAFITDAEKGWGVWSWQDVWVKNNVTDSIRAIRAVLSSLFPSTGGPNEIPNRMLANNAYGDSFDVLVANLKERPLKADLLKGYPVAMLLGEMEYTEALCNELQTFVEKEGGTLVLRARDAKAFPVGFLPAALDAKTEKAQSFLWAGAAKETPCPAFLYHSLAKTPTAQTIVSAPGGKTVVAACRRGKGTVILAGVDMFLDAARNKTCGFFPRLVMQLVSESRPVHVVGDVQYFLNRRGGRWIVGLINNRGFYKECDRPETIKNEEVSKVEVLCRGKAKEVKLLYPSPPNEVNLRTVDDRLHLTVPAGGILVMEIAGI